jgi:hypothetical protein
MTMSAPRLEWAFVDRLERTEPEFGSHAGHSVLDMARARKRRPLDWSPRSLARGSSKKAKRG